MSLIVNLFAGPGAGKSTMAARVFAGLKDHGVSTEMALEFAKDLTWERRYGAMGCQPYVFGEQLYRVQRLVDAGVEVVVTDSPLALSAIYGEHLGRHWRETVLDAHDGFTSMNFEVVRVKPYDPRGRRQDEESAKSIDRTVGDFLRKSGIAFQEVQGTEDGARHVVREVLSARPH